jgi:hypothetical protein
MADPIRNAAGRYVSAKCPDPNCNGTLRPEGEDLYRCDGLTFDREDGPLRACKVTLNPLYDRVPA